MYPLHTQALLLPNLWKDDKPPSDTPNEGVHIDTPCHIAEYHNGMRINDDGHPCKHTHFIFKPPLSWGGDSVADIEPYNSGHNFTTDGVTFRFITSHLGEDVPNAVRVTFYKNDPKSSALTFYGASAKREGDGYALFENLYEVLSDPSRRERRLCAMDINMFITRLKVMFESPAGRAYERWKAAQAGRPKSPEGGCTLL